ncbi:thermostable hemolysin [Salinicola sp. JS01]|uniref:thermostable hemolysin n=1 Tax=Salinicola sp. JS01 TaxID=3050071 RepID=UPI00255C2108|nr:thermostable hemolysin [Salinicola sp. JS01]WIX31718.1 thermostable hemolysin [Salinicola sp. JS01]
MPGLPLTFPTATLHWRECQKASERAQLEDFIATTYRRQHGAELSQFAPRLYGLWEADQLQAAVGVRLAGDAPLYLERYLSEPVECLLARELNAPVARHALAEIANLATLRPGLAVPLIRHLIESLVAEGCGWLTFTATAAVRNGFRRLGLDVRRLGDADPAYLDADERERWGNYYLHRPWVMGGDLIKAWRRLDPSRELTSPDSPTPLTVTAQSCHHKVDPHA